MNTRGHTVRNLILLALTGLVAVTAQAADGTKTDTATMNQAADWSNGALGTGDTGTFDDTISTANAANLTLGGDLSISALVFNNNLNGPVTIGAGNTLTLNSTGTGLDLSAANQNVTLNCAVTPSASQTWNVGGGRTLTLGGTLTNLVGALTKTGDGQLVVGNVIKGGVFTLKSDGGSLVVNGDISQSPHPTANSFYLDGTANGTVNGSIDDVFALRKNGTGTWTLTGSNPLIYTETGSRAGVEINIGALNVQHAGALGTINNVTVARACPKFRDFCQCFVTTNTIHSMQVALSACFHRLRGCEGHFAPILGRPLLRWVVENQGMALRRPCVAARW